MNLEDVSLHKLRHEYGFTTNQIMEMINELSDEEAEKILNDWRFWARPKQIPPDTNWRFFVMLMGRGGGKLLRDSESVLTTDGWKTFGTIEEGDFVYDETGTPTKVTGVYPQGLQQIWRVYFSDGSYVDSGKDHLWTTWTHRDRKQYMRRETPSPNFPPKNWPAYVGKNYDAWGNVKGYFGPQTITTEEMKDTLTIGKRGDSNHCIPVTEPLNLEEKDLPLDPYLFGLWIGDGTKSGGTFTCDKRDLIYYEEAIKDAGFNLGSLTQPENRPGTGRATAIGLVHYLRNIGALGNKEIPEEYLYGSTAQRTAFLQGLMDSDGYAERAAAEFTSMRKDHAEAVKWLATSLGQKPVLNTGRAMLNGINYGTKYRVTFKPTIDVFRIPRKKESVYQSENQQSRKNHRMVKDIEVLDEEDYCTCISVDSPNRLYLTGEELIPTHNTWAGSNWIIERALQGKGPIGIIGQTSGDVRDVQIEAGPSSILQQSPKDFKPEYQPSKRRLEWPNGVKATLFSGDEPDQLRGANLASIWADELGKWMEIEEAFNQINLCLRIGDSKCFITTTPTPHDIIKHLYRRGADEDDFAVHVVTGSTLENRENLDEEYVNELKRAYEGTRLEKQEIEGSIIWQSEEALFSQDDIDANRIKEENFNEIENFVRIAIGVDPAVSDKKGSDNTGIIVGAIGESGHGYLLEDATTDGSPAKWAERVNHLFNQYHSEYGIVPTVSCEKNNGGLLVTETLTKHGLDENRIKLVHASQGKMVRMEPIALMVEQGRIHFVGYFPELEDQLVTYEGKPNQKSPDNYDAFAWTFHDLLMGKKRTIQSKQFLV